MALVSGLLIGTTTLCCIAGAIDMFFEGVDPGPGGLAKYAGVYGYIVQVIFGLLMFSAVAPTALAEERQRGSLDVLLTTPLSTRTIVLGKWWGTYRLIPLIAFGPTIMAFAMAYGPSHGGPAFAADRLYSSRQQHGLLLMPATLLAHGAFLTSIGLAMATWIRRPARAMAISVTAYVLIAIAWPILYFSVVGGAKARENFSPALSPIFVAGSLADVLALNVSLGSFLWYASIWGAIVLISAMGLLWATVRTFDRCLGRMPETESRAAPGDAEDRKPCDAVVVGEWEGG
jgi:ABC-type transport system involved in multi-copper enzyme maturation permease subunit